MSNEKHLHQGSPEVLNPKIEMTVEGIVHTVKAQMILILMSPLLWGLSVYLPKDVPELDSPYMTWIPALFIAVSQSGVLFALVKQLKKLVSLTAGDTDWQTMSNQKLAQLILSKNK